MKSESRTALLRVLENHRIQDKIESATEVASELRHTAWIATRHREESEERANSIEVLDKRHTNGNALVYVKLSNKGECEIEDDEEHQVSAVSKMLGEEWKRLRDQVKEPYRKEYEAAKAQYDRDANGGTNEKGTAALRKETLQLKESKKASKDKDAPKRPAGGIYGQLLAEKREEIKKSLSADHKITDVIKKGGERWKISACR